MKLRMPESFPAWHETASSAMPFIATGKATIARRIYDSGLSGRPTLSSMGWVDAEPDSARNVNVIGPSPMVAPWWISIGASILRPSILKEHRLKLSLLD